MHQGHQVVHRQPGGTFYIVCVGRHVGALQHDGIQAGVLPHQALRGLDHVASGRLEVQLRQVFQQRALRLGVGRVKILG